MSEHDCVEVVARTPGEVSGSPVFQLSDRLAGFFLLIRPLFFILTPVNAAAASVLAVRGFPPLDKCILGSLAVAFASCAVNVFNDYVDRQRDRKIWPKRPIPSGRVKPAEALLVVITSLIISICIAWLVFNPLTFWILLAAAVSGGFYSAYLRDRMGYLSLPPIVGLIYLGGWAAFSPDTLFHSWLPWYLYLLGVVWQTAHILIYYPLHAFTSNGATSKGRETPVFLFAPSPRTATAIGIIFTCLTLLLAVFLVFLTTLTVPYLCFVCPAGVCAIFYGLRLHKNVLDRRTGFKAFTALTLFRLIISAAILMSFCL